MSSPPDELLAAISSVGGKPVLRASAWRLAIGPARSPLVARTAIASEGVGTTHARLFDARGYFGESLQTLFVERRS